MAGSFVFFLLLLFFSPLFDCFLLILLFLSLSFSSHFFPSLCRVHFTNTHPLFKMIRQSSNGDLSESTPGTTRLNSPRQRRTLPQSRGECVSPLAHPTSAPASPQGLAVLGPQAAAAVAAGASVQSHPETDSPSTVLNIGGLTLNSPCSDSTSHDGMSVCEDGSVSPNGQQLPGYFTPQPASLHVCSLFFPPPPLFFPLRFHHAFFCVASGNTGPRDGDAASGCCWCCNWGCFCWEIVHHHAAK